MVKIDFERDTDDEIAEKMLVALKTDLVSRGIDYDAIKNAPLFGFALKQLFAKQLELSKFYDICQKVSIFNHAFGKTGTDRR